MLDCKKLGTGVLTSSTSITSITNMACIEGICIHHIVNGLLVASEPQVVSDSWSKSNLSSLGD